MPRTCTVCQHPDRGAIDSDLIAGLSAPKIAAKYRDIGVDSIDRHRVHLPAALVEAVGEEKVKQALDVVVQLRAVNGASLQILKEAREAKDGELALKAIDRIQRQIELQAKLLGELDERPVVNLLVAPEWLQLRSRIVVALRDYPEAALAIAEVISIAGN